MHQPRCRNILYKREVESQLIFRSKFLGCEFKKSSSAVRWNRMFCTQRFHRGYDKQWRQDVGVWFTTVSLLKLTLPGGLLGPTVARHPSALHPRRTEHRWGSSSPTGVDGRFQFSNFEFPFFSRFQTSFKHRREKKEARKKKEEKKRNR